MFLTHELVPGNNKPSALTCCLQASPGLITQPFPAILFPDPNALLYPAGDRSSGPWVPPLQGVTRWHSGHWHIRWPTSLGHLVSSRTWYQPAPTSTNWPQPVPTGSNRYRSEQTRPSRPAAAGRQGAPQDVRPAPPPSAAGHEAGACEVLPRAAGNVAGYRACMKKAFWIPHLHDISFTHDTSFSNDP